jgi:hypothetical protein
MRHKISAPSQTRETSSLKQEFSEILNIHPFLPLVGTRSDEKFTEGSEADKANVWRIGVLWDVTFHWVFREKWGKKKDKLPFKPRLVKVVEPFARLMFWILELCIQCQSLQPYKHGSIRRFLCIVQEAQIAAFHSTKVEKPLGKTEILKVRRSTVKKLAEKNKKTKLRENPYNPNNLPHLHKLINTCINSPLLAGNPGSDNFEEKYWEPFLSSYRTWNTAFDSANWSTVVEKDNKPYNRQHLKNKPSLVLIHVKKDLFETLTGQGF